MSAERGFQAALAALLVDDAARSKLREDPGALRLRYALTDEETAILMGIDPERLRVTAAVGRAKRLEFVRRGLPGTTAALNHTGHHHLLAEFARRTRATADQPRTSRVLGESRRFAGYLTGLPKGTGQPDWISDLAAFELSIVELLADGEADSSARLADCVQGLSWRRGSVLDPSSGGHVMLGRHTKVASYRYDVLDLYEAPLRAAETEVETEPTQVVVAKTTTVPKLRVYRVSAAVADLLARWTVPRPWAQVLAEVEVSAEPAADAVVRRVLSAGLLVPAGPDGVVGHHTLAGRP